MSTKYKIISFGIKPTRSLTLVPVGRLMSIHIKYNGYGYMLSLLFGQRQTDIHSGHIPKLFRLIRVVQMECFYFFSGNISM